MRETSIRLHSGSCIVGRVQRTLFVLEEGEPLEITPAPDLWVSGTYHYDAEHGEHYWKSDDEHFVGLVDGMKVRIADKQGE
jgi:hypothetical protein